MNDLSPFQALQQGDFFSEFVQQLRKDFEGAGEALNEGITIPNDLQTLTNFLAHQLKLIDRNGHLQGLLYRIDISERQIKEATAKQMADSFEEILADLIIRRILQKVILRKKFNS
jgi:hypothetical protein